jgi:hypothetical protein
MSHYSGYRLDRSIDIEEVIIGSVKFGSWNSSTTNESSLHWSGYKAMDEKSGKILGFKSRYGNNA